jgi:hypothetical protein
MPRNDQRNIIERAQGGTVWVTQRDFFKGNHRATIDAAGEKASGDNAALMFRLSIGLPDIIP